MGITLSKFFSSLTYHQGKQKKVLSVGNFPMQVTWCPFLTQTITDIEVAYLLRDVRPNGLLKL